MKDNLSKVEEFAALIHHQWSRWAKYMLSNYSPENIKKWQTQMKTPYSKLSEKEKNSDRFWANEFLKLISN